MNRRMRDAIDSHRDDWVFTRLHSKPRSAATGGAHAPSRAKLASAPTPGANDAPEAPPHDRTNKRCRSRQPTIWPRRVTQVRAAEPFAAAAESCVTRDLACAYLDELVSHSEDGDDVEAGEMGSRCDAARNPDGRLRSDEVSRAQGVSGLARLPVREGEALRLNVGRIPCHKGLATVSSHQCFRVL